MAREKKFDVDQSTATQAWIDNDKYLAMLFALANIVRVGQLIRS